jgi:hypothetical protein
MNKLRAGSSARPVDRAGSPERSTWQCSVAAAAAWLDGKGMRWEQPAKRDNLRQLFQAFR